MCLSTRTARAVLCAPALPLCKHSILCTYHHTLLHADPDRPTCLAPRQVRHPFNAQHEKERKRGLELLMQRRWACLYHIFSSLGTRLPASEGWRC